MNNTVPLRDDIEPEDDVQCAMQTAMHAHTTKLASSYAAAMRFNATIKDAKDDGISFTTGLANGLLQGKSLMDSLASSATALGQKLVDSGITSLLNQGLNALTGGGTGVTGAAATVTLTSGAAAASAAITAAGATAGAALAAGGTAAALALAGGGTAAGNGISLGTADASLTLDLATSNASTAFPLAGSGAAAPLDLAVANASVALPVAGATAGAALWGPLAAVGAIAVGIGLVLGKMQIPPTSKTETR